MDYISSVYHHDDIAKCNKQVGHSEHSHKSAEQEAKTGCRQGGQNQS